MATFLKPFLFLIVLFGVPATAFEVTEAEKQDYLTHSQHISETAALCLNNTWQTHIDFFEQWKVSKYYGDRNRSYGTRELRLKALEEYGAPLHLIDELEAISCIGLTLKCFREGFESTGHEGLKSLWSRLDRHVRDHGVSGVHLVNNLQKLGWTILYWNPLPEHNLEWDLEDQALLPGRPVEWNSGVVNDQGQFIYHPGWGVHERRFQEVMGRNKYYTLHIDDKSSLVGFDMEMPSFIKEFPLAVGVAHAGYHVFPVRFGEVIEAHSSRPLNSISNLERSLFNPLHKEGGPVWSRSEKYRSGVIAVPPLR